jgi:hypothetical protein
LSNIFEASFLRESVIIILSFAGALTRDIQLDAKAVCRAFGDVKDKRIITFFDFVVASDLASLGHLEE